MCLWITKALARFNGWLDSPEPLSIVFAIGVPFARSCLLFWSSVVWEHDLASKWWMLRQCILLCYTVPFHAVDLIKPVPFALSTQFKVSALYLSSQDIRKVLKGCIIRVMWKVNKQHNTCQRYISYFPRFDFTLYKYMFERSVSVDYFSKLSNLSAGAVPGFLERGFICINMWGFALLILSHFV